MKSLYRSRLTLLLSLFLLLLPSLALSAETPLPVPDKNPGIQRLKGLDRHYDLSFLWFDRLATGQLSFVQDPAAPNQYRATLEARTLGVAAWLTGDRIQRYEALMEMTPQGGLRPLVYSAKIHKVKGGITTEQVKLYTFDAATRTIMMTKSKDGQSGIEKPVKFLSDLFPVDFMTAGFNFISEADGPIHPGMKKEITSFSNEGVRTISIEVLTPDKWPKTPFFKAGSGTLLKISLPSDILDTGGGAVYALLDAQLLPDRVIVENVLGMGDVRGKQ